MSSEQLFVDSVIMNYARDVRASGHLTKARGGASMSYSIPNPPKKVTSGIYAIVNRINGKRYIGSSVDVPARWRSHVHELNKNKHHSLHLQSAWNKYGKENFDFIVLEECSPADLLSREQAYLNQSFPEYNTIQLAGNNYGFRFPDEAKRRMSEIHTGFRHTEESKKRMSEIWSGKPRGPQSEEAKRKMSQAKRGKKPTEKQKKALEKGRDGHVVSEETRQKISNAQKGYRPKESTLEKLRQAWIRRRARKSHAL